MTPTPMSLSGSDLDQRSVNAIRVLAMDAVQRANSGHPGLPMGAADLAYVLFSRFLRFDSSRPDWPDRDRFVLSAGHGSMLLYALLHLTGYDLPLTEIQDFRQWKSRTPGHPEHGETPGVETTTGPLGQGIATAVGFAMAERHLAARVNGDGLELVNHFTYVLASDGDMMEGVQAEAVSLAGHLGLGRLIVLYDDNRITIDGSTDLAFTENVGGRFTAYGWHVQHIDGHDRDAVGAAIEAARLVTDRPSLIQARTHIALGSPNKQDSEAAHGSPLGDEEIAATKAVYAWPVEPPFFVPDDVRDHFLSMGRRHRPERESWETRLAECASTHPERAALWEALHRETIELSSQDRPVYEPGTKTATRAASGKALNWISGVLPSLWGGSADLAPSNMTFISGEAAFSKNSPDGRNLHFGIREHGMAAALNGIALHGGLVPYGGTFLVFADYMRPAVRLAALMKQRVVYVFTHDSIFLGEDGPTHQPIAQLASLRAIPNLVVIRPCDGEETTQAWETALGRTGPTALVLTRQGLPELDRAKRGITETVARGAYVAHEPDGEPHAIVFATGSEVAPALSAAETLATESRRIRVVSVPSWELFETQDESYRTRVLSPEIRCRAAVEAGASLGWERFVGMEGIIIAIDRFGASAPAARLAEAYGFTAEAIAHRLRERLV